MPIPLYFKFEFKITIQEISIAYDSKYCDIYILFKFHKNLRVYIDAKVKRLEAQIGLLAVVGNLAGAIIFKFFFFSLYSSILKVLFLSLAVKGLLPIILMLLFFLKIQS